LVLSFYNSLRTISSTPTEYWKDSMEALVDAKFDNSPTIKTVTHNGTSIVVRVVGKFNTETLSRNNDNYQKIIFKDSDYTVDIGDLFVFDSLTWLCTDVSSTPVSKSCSVQLCNNTLSYYSTTTSTLYSIPCIITDKLLLNQDENKYITTVDNQVYMIVSNTTTTRQINPSDIFKIGIYNYEVVSTPDDITKSGLLVFKLKYSEVEQVLPVFTVEILNGSTLTTGVGTNVQLNCVVKNGTTPLSPTPSLIYSSSSTSVCTVSSTGLVTPVINGSATITVKLASDLTILDTIAVTVSVTQNNYTYTLSSTSTPDTEIKLNQTKTYTAQKYNNGVAVVQTFTFSVSGDATAYTLTTVDGNNCTIKCLKSGYTVVLSATDISDVTKVTTKTITLKSLF